MKLRICYTFILITLLQLSMVAQSILFTNVNIFDGTTEQLITGQDVLVEKNLISKIGSDLKGPKGSTVIDGQGMTLMPGLIDSHTHLNMYKTASLHEFEGTTWEEIGARAAAFAQEMLAMGFTTIRDMGGAHVGLKKVIDEGLLPGPRIYAAGGFVSQTSGHGDFGMLTQRKGETNMERLEIARVVDGRDEVLEAARRNYALGAVYTKVMVSGGVTSLKDPIYASQFSDDELSAAVETAEDWGSYVAVHVFQNPDLKRITTEVSGNCGSSPFPKNDHQRALSQYVLVGGSRSW